jgi:GT2 family glycosyltransferase
VSIVIPTRDRPDLLRRCIDSVLQGGSPGDVELVVVDNGSKDPHLLDLLRSFQQRAIVRTIARDIPFNFPLLCNAGVEAARGRVIILLNNDAEVRAGWLDELVPLATRTDVGAVGPLVLYPDGRIQSAGVLVGVNRTATSALEGFDPRTRAAQDWCASRRRVSAVLGACMAIEREKYLRHGGLDAAFAVSHNEVDFCLRLEASGLANVFTPFARVVHVEGATRGFEVTATERARLEVEERQFLARWGVLLDAVDPAHHAAFARSGNPFLLAPAPLSLPTRAGWRSGVCAGVGGDGAMPG